MSGGLGGGGGWHAQGQGTACAGTIKACIKNVPGVQVPVKVQVLSALHVADSPEPEYPLAHCAVHEPPYVSSQLANSQPALLGVPQETVAGNQRAATDQGCRGSWGCGFVEERSRGLQGVVEGCSREVPDRDGHWAHGVGTGRGTRWAKRDALAEATPDDTDNPWQSCTALTATTLCNGGGARQSLPAAWCPVPGGPELCTPGGLAPENAQARSQTKTNGELPPPPVDCQYGPPSPLAPTRCPARASYGDVIRRSSERLQRAGERCTTLKRVVCMWREGCRGFSRISEGHECQGRRRAVNAKVVGLQTVVKRLSRVQRCAGCQAPCGVW